MPSDYFNKPRLYPDLQGSVEMFFELSPSRQMGFGAGAIPVSEIKDHFELFGIDGYEIRKFFFRRMRLMDNIYLDIVNNKNKPEQNNKKKSTLINSSGGKLRA